MNGVAREAIYLMMRRGRGGSVFLLQGEDDTGKEGGMSDKTNRKGTSILAINPSP